LESVPSTDFGSDVADSESDDDCSALFSKEETIIIFDWDDTILPTTWLDEQGVCDLEAVPSQEHEEQLQALTDQAIQTLLIAKAHGTVVFVTNAEHGWIELSCQKFMPSLYPLLQDVKILSARTKYEASCSFRPAEWKHLAFRDEIDGFCELVNQHRRKNILSIGDSPHEREALIRVTERIPNSCVKAMKLIMRPRLEQLRQQHELIGGCFRDIVDHNGCLDVCIDGACA